MPKSKQEPIVLERSARWKLDPDGGNEGDKVDGGVGGDGDVHIQGRRRRRKRREGKKGELAQIDVQVHRR